MIRYSPRMLTRRAAEQAQSSLNLLTLDVDNAQFDLREFLKQQSRTFYRESKNSEHKNEKFLFIYCDALANNLLDHELVMYVKVLAHTMWTEVIMARDSRDDAFKVIIDKHPHGMDLKELRQVNSFYNRIYDEARNLTYQAVKITVDKCLSDKDLKELSQVNSFFNKLVYRELDENEWDRSGVDLPENPYIKDIEEEEDFMRICEPVIDRIMQLSEKIKLNGSSASPTSVAAKLTDVDDSSITHFSP